MTNWDETDETGEIIHLRMGLTKDGWGPADPPDPLFDHWGCWCPDPTCPGPPVKPALLHDTAAHILAGGFGITAKDCPRCESELPPDPPPGPGKGGFYISGGLP